MKNFKTEATLICIGLVICGFLIGKGIKSFADKDRTVYVKGLSEKIVDANHGSLKISYTTGGNDMQGLLNEIDANNSKILALVKSKGLKESDVTIGVPNITDKKNTEYENNYVGNSFRYYASVSLTIVSDNAKAIREVEMAQSSLLKEGINIRQSDYYDATSAQYNFTNINELKPEMLKEAAANAKKSAKELSANTGSKISSIKSASQGTFEIERTENPLKLKVRVVSTIEYFLR